MKTPELLLKIESTTSCCHADVAPPAPEWFEFRRPFLAAVLFLSALTVSHAQTLSIDWFTMDAGGGKSTGGVFSVIGTIGQPEANATAMSGGNFSLVGGFWSFLAVQTPGAPFLTMQLISTNTALISWPSPSPGFTLQQNADLNTTNWIAAPQSVSDNGARKFIIVTPPAGNRFYRLLKP